MHVCSKPKIIGGSSRALLINLFIVVVFLPQELVLTKLMNTYIKG